MKTPSDYGLHHEEFRTYQQDSADWILSLRDSNYPVAILQAPTGSCKTSLAKAAAHAYSATSLCRTKALQRENYGHLYGFDVLFGRRNYPCIHKDARGDATAGDCRFSEKGMHKCPDAGKCPYLTQKAIVKASNCRSLNYYYWLAARWPRKYATDYLVLDECHELPALVTDWAGTYVSEASRREWELPEFPVIRDASGLLHKPKDYSSPYRTAIGWFTNAYQELSRQYRWLSQRVNTEKYRRRVRQCESFGFKIAATLQALNDSPLDWFIKSGPIVGRDRNGRPCPTIVTKPLTARHHFKKQFNVFQTTVLMSATIGNFDALAEELGIDTYCTRDVPSIWPPESRPVYTFTNAPRLGHKSPPEDYALQADIISKAILGCPPEWSGIIHVTRKTEATMLADRLARRGLQDRIVAMPQLPTDQQMTWWQSYKLKTPNAITVSWAWTEGVDLGEERICISAKCFTPDVKLLGPDGEIGLADAINSGGRIFALDEEGKLIIEHIDTENIILVNWDGDVYDLKASHCDITITSNHDMLVSTQTGTDPWSEFHKVEMGDLDKHEFRVPTHAKGWRGKIMPPKKCIRDFLPEDALLIYEPVKKGKGRGKGLPECFEYYPSRTAFRARFWDLPSGWGPTGKAQVQDRLHANLFPWDYNFKDMIELLGWYISEGNLFHGKEYRYETTVAGETWGIAISQNEGEILGKIKELLDRMGIPYAAHPSSKERKCFTLVVHNIAFYSAFRQWCGEGSRNKRIPRFLLDMNIPLLKVLFETLMKGDGCITPHGTQQYSTSSVGLKNNMVELGLKLGYRVYPVLGKKGNWVITFIDRRKKGTIRRPRNVTQRHYEGVVWCVKTQTGTLMAGRNGRFIFTGNCPFPHIGSDFERARMQRSPKMYLQRAAWGLEQSLGRTRRGRAQDYDLDGEHRGFVAIVDENWRRVRNYLSTTLLEAIVESEFPL